MTVPAAALLAAALAAGPDAILLPPWSLAPDGEAVAVRGGAALAVEGGRIATIGPGLFRVIPDPGVRAVRLAAGAATAVAAVEPPPGAITLSASPAAPVKGRDRTVALRLRVEDGGSPADAPPPVLVASVGAIGAPEPDGGGGWRAVYALPETLHPEVAVVIAMAPRRPLEATPRALGAVVIPLSASIALRGRTEPDARIEVRVAGRAFGPVHADAEGRFSVPVVVPPGARIAASTSIDPAGNRRVQELDLHLPPVDQLACAAWPGALPADGAAEAELACVAATPGGAPAPGAGLVLSGADGRLTPLSPFRGALQRARYRAPLGGAPREEVVTASWPAAGPASRDAIRIALATGAPARLAWRIAGGAAPAGASAAARAEAIDGRGDVLGPAAAPPGAIDGFVASDRFVARPGGAGVQPAPLRFRLPPGAEVATLSLAREPGGWRAEARDVAARPVPGARVAFGSGAVAVTDADGVARVAGGGEAETVRAANGARAAGWAEIAPLPSPIALEEVIPVPVRPASPVDVVAWVEGHTLRWRVDGAGGAPLRGRRVTVRGAGVEVGPPEPDGAGGRAPLGAGAGTVAVIDAETGVAAVVEVR